MQKATGGEFPTISTEHDISGTGTVSELIAALLKLGREYQSGTEVQIIRDGKMSSGLLSTTHGPLQDINAERDVLYMSPQYLAQKKGHFVEDKGSVRHILFGDAQVNWVIHQPQN